MKRTGLILFFVIVAGLWRCNEIESLLTFGIQHTVSLEIPATAPIQLPIEIPTPEVTTNSDQSFQSNNTKASLVKDIRLESLALTITAPSGKTFNFLESITIYISTDSDPEIELATLTEVPQNVSTINLDPTDEKLDAYVKAQSYQLRTSIVTKESLTQDVEVNAAMLFRVTAQPL